ncbi:hypothetical protein SIPHO049v1_p0036 [Vibrio phage PS14A.1]|nr:hypothetical protein SIPHO049v1_p0036 [Vibrio phage PS14A.1]
MSEQYNYEFPVVRGFQSGRTFYLATVPLRVLKNMFKLDVGDGSALSRSQRDVNLNRAKKFAKYLHDNRSNFVIPALTGFVDLDSGLEVKFTPSDSSENVGILSVPMDAAMLFVDGQHRATGTSVALEDKDLRGDIGSNSAPVMLFESLTLEERQSMFSDINGNVAKPAQALSDTYNNRDDLAVFARELSETVPQFKDMVDYERNVISSKSTYLFSIKTIKEVTATVLGLKGDAKLSESDKVTMREFWKLWFEGIGFDGKFKIFGNEAIDFREHNIMTMGVVMKAAALAVKEVGLNKVDFSKLNNISWTRESVFFADRCVDPKLGTMKADATATKLTAAKMLIHMGVPLTSNLATIERQVFGDYVAPETPKPVEPVFKQVADMGEAFEFNGYEPMIKEFTSGMTPEQLEEAVEKAHKIESEARDRYRELDLTSEEYIAFYRRIYLDALTNIKETQKPEHVENCVAKMCLNVRSLRAATSEAAYKRITSVEV